VLGKTNFKHEPKFRTPDGTNARQSTGGSSSVLAHLNSLGNFLAIIAPEPLRDEAHSVFGSGLELAHTLKLQSSKRTVETPWSVAASFPRRNGTGTSIVTDQATGSWLLAIGTWFHSQGFAVGDEARLLQCYLQVGAKTLSEELEGFFNIVIGDTRTRQAVVITDVVGSCHCFVRKLGAVTALSGSSLLIAALEATTPDVVACQEFLCTGIIYEDRTFCREVRKLSGASIHYFSVDAPARSNRYWHTDTIPAESLDVHEAADELWHALTHAVRRITSVFKRPVCDLTGGYDSRAIASALVAESADFTATVSGRGDSPDVLTSRGLASLLGLPHLHFPEPTQRNFGEIKGALPLTDGEYDLIEYARVLSIHASLAEKFDISINGSFGEVARGYWWELLFPHTGERRLLDSRKLAQGRYAVGPHTSSLFPVELRLDLIDHFAGIIGRTNADLTQAPNTLQMDNAYLFMRMQRWQGRIASSTNQLWPCISPFMFRRVLETMLATKARARQRSLLIRQMLARYQRRIAEYPLEHGYPALPATWSTVGRFWPLVPYYTTKVVHRLSNQLRLQLPTDTPPQSEPARLSLWQDEEVREMFERDSQRTAFLFDAAALQNFLDRSRTQDFGWNAQWCRLLTMEYTFRLLERVNATPRSAPTAAEAVHTSQ